MDKVNGGHCSERARKRRCRIVATIAMAHEQLELQVIIVQISCIQPETFVLCDHSFRLAISICQNARADRPEAL